MMLSNTSCIDESRSLEKSWHQPCRSYGIGKYLRRYYATDASDEDACPQRFKADGAEMACRGGRWRSGATIIAMAIASTG
jgi:hypothetical protein